jgi:hypothetical protein
MVPFNGRPSIHNGRQTEEIGPMNLPLKWELTGIAFIFFTGSAFHFIYEWSGYRKIVALFGAVNESTWEHLKLAFWPGLLFAFLEYPFIGNQVKNFWAGKSVGLIAMPTIIVIIFYSYTAIFERNYLAADIGSFFVAVALGQLLSYTVMTSSHLPQITRWLGILTIVALTICFSLFTYFPPRVFLFKDPRFHQYGILD